MPILADVNVWLATLLEGHPHHEVVIDWWRTAIAPKRASVRFCRVTQLGFLRLLSNERVMGAARRRPEQAWSDYRAFLAQPLVAFTAEPDGVDPIFADLTASEPASAGLWTDAYLASFALAAGFQLATLDRGFRRFGRLPLQLLD